MEGITRGYKAEDVVNLRGSVNIECTLARLGSETLEASKPRNPLCALGAMTGNQAIQEIQADLKRFIVQAGRLLETETVAVKCTLIRAFMQLTQCQK